MRILHFSHNDGPGGAAQAAYRIHQLFVKNNCDSQMIVFDKHSQDPTVTEVDKPALKVQWHRAIKNLPWMRRRKTKFTFNQNREVGVSLRGVIKKFHNNVDFIFIHWVNGLLTTRSIRQLSLQLRVPIICFMHDQEIVTGGCHYSFGCTRFAYSCGNCPLLVDASPHDLSHRVWQSKKKLLTDLRLIFAGPSNWCAARVRESSLFRNFRAETIHYPIDEQLYLNQGRSESRAALQLPADRSVILFGASYLKDQRKGPHLLTEALHHLRTRWIAENRDPAKIHLAFVGTDGEELAAQCPFSATLLGPKTSTQEMAQAYRAADIFTCPTLQDTGPMMISEAMLCGTPSVAFDMGVAPDIIQSDRAGYLAKLGDSQDLAVGLHRVLTEQNFPDMATRCRERAMSLHSAPNVWRNYQELFASLKNAN